MDAPEALAEHQMTQPPDLGREAGGVVAVVAAALRTVIERAVEGTATTRELERTLGLNKTLAWKVLQVAYGRDPLASAHHIPGAEGLEKFLRAAAKRGVEKESLEAVRLGAARYREMVKSHAGDRVSLEVMLQGLSALEDGEVELKAARRAGFRSAGYAWGVQTAVRVLSAIITPTTEDLVDLATVRAHVRMRRVRKEGLLRLSRTIEHDTDEIGPRRAKAQAIEPENLEGGVPLLRSFCTQPLPRLQSVEGAGQAIEYQMMDQGLGERSAVTVFTGEIRRGLGGARYRTEANSTNALMMTIRDPVGLAVIDLWTPLGLFREHKALVVSAIAADPLRQKPDEWQVLPAATSVERMGRGVRAARIDEAPDYEPAFAQCMSRLQWDAEDYELHRVRLDYPVLGSCLILRTTLPER